MERNKMIGLLVSAILVLSSVIYLISAPSSYVSPGTYSGKALGHLVKYVDQQWVIPDTATDMNGFYVVDRGNGYYIISVGDKNATLNLLREKGIPFYLRDAVVSANVSLGGTKRDMNIYAFVNPDHNVGDPVLIAYAVTIGADGSIQARGQELGNPQ
jgi:hypothetical protein